MSHPKPFTVASWNIHKGVGADRRRDLARTAAVIAEIAPDIMALQEADNRFGDRAGLLDLDHLHHIAGMTLVPLNIPGPSHGWHGNLLLVRDAKVAQVQPIPLPGFEPRGALITDLDVGGRGLRVVGTHFGLLRRSRQSQIHALLEKLDRLEPLPTLLMGDLNEWRSGRGSPMALLQHHFQPTPLLRSFPARFPLLPLDRMMIGPTGNLSDFAVHDTPLARRASDHLPIKARLPLGTRP